MMRLFLAPVLILMLAPSLNAGDHVQVAVLRFLQREGTEEDRWLSTGLADLLGGVLAGREDLVVVERERVADLLRELKLLEKGILDPEEAGRVANVAAADRAILGTYAVSDGQLEIEASLVDAATGKVLHVARVRGATDDLIELVTSLAAEVCGGNSPGPSAKVNGLPIHALAEYYRGIRAEERGDYPKAFLFLSRAARTKPPHPRAGLDLGGLYARMGEPLHAAAEWRNYAGARTDDDAVDALRLAARALENAGEPARAAGIWEDLAEREPLRKGLWVAVTRSARLRARAGDGKGAMAGLTRGAGALRAEILRIKEDSKTWYDYPRCRGLVIKLEPLQHAMGKILEYRRRFFAEEFLAGRSSLPPPDVIVLDPDDPSLSWERLAQLSAAGVPSTFDMGAFGHSFHVLAPRGLAIAAARFTVSLIPNRTERPRPGQVSVFPWGCGAQDGVKSLPLVDEARTEEFRIDLPRPASLVQIGASGLTRSIESYGVRFDLVPAQKEDWPPRPALARRIVSGVAGFAQNPRISRDRQGRYHVVFNDGPFRMLFGRAMGQILSDGESASLFLATSKDGGKTFSPPRRLPVSSERNDLDASLLHARDGTHHLVWLSNRSDRSVFRLWYSNSRDLVRWAYPRQVPVPFVPLYGTLMPNAGVTVGSAPVLVEDRDRRIHLFLSAGWADEGEGIYRMDTTDGLSWSAPSLVVAGQRTFNALSFPDGTLLVASRGTGETATIHRSPDGRTWTAKQLEIEGETLHWGGQAAPLLVLLDDGTILLHEWLSMERARLSVSKDGVRWTGRTYDLKDCWLRSAAPVDADRALAVFGIHMPERPGMLFLMPLDVTR